MVGGRPTTRRARTWWIRCRLVFLGFSGSRLDRKGHSDTLSRCPPKADLDTLSRCPPKADLDTCPVVPVIRPASHLYIGGFAGGCA